MAKVYPYPMRKEQKDALLAAAEAEDEFDYVLFLTLATTGRRIGELYGVQSKKLTGRRIVGKRTIYIEGVPQEIDKSILTYSKLKEWKYGVKVEDIDFDRGVMKIWVLKKRKFEVQEESLLTPKLIRTLSQYIKRNRLANGDYVFRRPGRSLRNIQNKIKYYAKKAHLPLRASKGTMRYALSLHSFRHYFVTELQRKGLRDEEIIKLTGHKETRTLTSYSHIVARDIKEKVMPVLDEL